MSGTLTASPPQDPLVAAADAISGTSPKIRTFAQMASQRIIALEGRSSAAIKGMYSFSNAGQVWPAIQSSTGCNLIVAGADDLASLTVVKASGGKVWATVGRWDDAAGAFSMNDAQALAVARAAVASYADTIVGWYVADEPSLAHVSAPRLIAARSALLKSVLPVESVIAMWDDSAFAAFKGSADAFALDGYPSRDGAWDMGLIGRHAAAAESLGIRYYGVVGAFTDGTATYPLPSPTQLQQMIAAWKATREAGLVYYAWGATGAASAQQLQNLPGLLAVIRAA